MPHSSTSELLALHAVRLKGFVDSLGAARRFGLDPRVVDEHLLDAHARGWVTRSGFAGTHGWSLTDAGRAANEAHLARELDETGARPEVEAAHAVTVPRRSVGLAALSGIGFGVFFVGIDIAATEDALWSATAARAGGVVVILAAAIAMPARVVFSRPAVATLLVIGALDVTANSLFAVASTEGLLSLVSVAGSLYPVVTVLLARIVLDERLGRLQQAGVALALGGVVLIAGG